MKKMILFAAMIFFTACGTSKRATHHHEVYFSRDGKEAICVKCGHVWKEKAQAGIVEDEIL